MYIERRTLVEGSFRCVYLHFFLLFKRTCVYNTYIGTRGWGCVKGKDGNGMIEQERRRPGVVGF